MKTTFYKIQKSGVQAFAVAASLMAVACSSEAELNLPAGNLSQITIGANTACDTESRMTIKGLEVKWVAADVLTVYGAPAVFTTADDNVQNASFVGSLNIEAHPVIYAVAHQESGIDALANFSEDASGRVTYNLEQDVTQTQSRTKAGSLNNGSIGKMMILCGKSDSELSAENMSANVTMNHITAIQDFKFTNVPAVADIDTDNPIVSLELCSSEPMLTSASYDFETGEVTPISYATSSIKVATTPAIYPSDLLIRVAVLPQTVKSSAVWSILVTMADGVQYSYDFGAATSDFDFKSGYCETLAVDWSAMKLVEADTNVLSLSTPATDYPADNNWVISSDAKPLIDEFANFNEACATAAAAGRAIEVTFSDITMFPTYALQNNEAVVIVNAPKVTAFGNTGVFQGCVNLTRVVAPHAAGEKLFNSNFNGCAKLVALNAPAGEEGIYVNSEVLRVNNYVFSGCESITKFVATGATSLGKNLFDGCTSLSYVEVATTSHSLTTSTNMFKGVPTENVDLVIGVSDGVDVDAKTWCDYTFKSITVK